jgi:tRNA threonylcarbamoyladenosine biosynthesis protein TsaB
MQDYRYRLSMRYNPAMSKTRRILAIETSGRSGSAAVADDTGLVAVAQLPGQMQHAAELIPTIAALLDERNWPRDSLTDVFVSIGPGSFTGLRIGASVARTLAWSIGAQIVAVPTVDALALNALDADPVPEHVAVVLDAKRNQIYTAAFEREAEKKASSYRKTVDAHMTDPLPFLSSLPTPLVVLGEGVDYHTEAIQASGATVLDKSLWPGRAENVYHVGIEMANANQYTDTGDLLPLYIRRPEAEEKWEKLHGN